MNAESSIHMSPAEALAVAKRLLKGGAAIGRLFEPPISRAAVNQWDECPAERVLTIERATGGQVTRHQLRPDLYPLPEDDGAVGEVAA